MTDLANEINAAAALPAQSDQTAAKGSRFEAVAPVLEKLFELYPHLFGAHFLPLKLGTFQELLARHPQQFERQALKAALAVHTRSSRYLQSVAAGNQRHDLDGKAVEAVAPEHVYFALCELFRRRQLHSKKDLRPRLRQQLLAAFLASGLSRQDYLLRVQGKDATVDAVLEEALSEHADQLARQEALRRAFCDSGKSVDEFAAMYGLTSSALAWLQAAPTRPAENPGSSPRL